MIKEITMVIENQDLPYAGKLFRFTVAGATGKTRIEAYIDTARVLERECPDPPCHEMVRVPVGTRGSVLRIVAKDLLGDTIERQFRIAESDTSSGGMMSSAR
jgi:hypothetical protein